MDKENTNDIFLNTLGMSYEEFVELSWKEQQKVLRKYRESKIDNVSVLVKKLEK